MPTAILCRTVSSRTSEALGGEYQAELLPINTSEFSATLIKAKAYKPNVLLNNMGGLAQINCMKQFTQFGMQKEMHLGGALFELETIKAVPADAQAGSWDMEWWWNQPNVPEVAHFVADFRKATGKTPSARHWFGYRRDAFGPPRRRKRPSRWKARNCRWHGGHGAAAGRRASARRSLYRAGDHELMSNIFVGDVHPPTATPTTSLPSPAWCRANKPRVRCPTTGCKMVHPA